MCIRDSAGVDFLVEFVGGLLLGILLGLLGNWVVKRARSIGVENTNFHVLFEVLIPFLIYLVANVCHVSGVIAVVVAGLINVTSPKGVIGPSVSRMNIVSGSVWHVLTYALNGIVFVLLGTQPVSYTHRDVYKRQGGDVAVGKGAIVGCGSVFASSFSILLVCVLCGSGLWLSLIHI